jgi:hypothetical protein
MQPFWQEFLDNLAPLPTNESTHTRKNNEPIVWVESGAPASGRAVEFSTTFYDLCTIATQDPEMAAIGKATYDSVTADGVNEKTPCPAVSRATLSAAKMGRSDHLRFLLPNQLRRLDPEHDDCDWEGAGKIGVMRNRMSLREGPGCIEFERGGLVARALHAALLMDSPPAPGAAAIIHVFAACPNDWDAEFTLLARGAFLVTSARKDGVVEFVELKSQAGGDCRLRNPWAETDVVLFRNGRRPEDATGNLLKFATARDETVLILKKGTVPAQFKRVIKPGRAFYEHTHSELS